MCETKFYICEHCGNLIGMIHDAGVPLMCCGQKMTLLEPGKAEAGAEKHTPVVTFDGSTVKVTVGTAAHPMTGEHSILWVYLRTDRGGQRKRLEAGTDPVVTFALSGEKPLAVYAYCNLHGLWKTDIEEKTVCDLKPVDTKTSENYIVCKCKNVSYFDILDALDSHRNIDALLDAFEDIKSTTSCTTGCGGCYNKVMTVISEYMSNK